MLLQSSRAPGTTGAVVRIVAQTSPTSSRPPAAVYSAPAWISAACSSMNMPCACTTCQNLRNVVTSP